MLSSKAPSRRTKHVLARKQQIQGGDIEVKGSHYDNSKLLLTDQQFLLLLLSNLGRHYMSLREVTSESLQTQIWQAGGHVIAQALGISLLLTVALFRYF